MTFFRKDTGRTDIEKNADRPSNARWLLVLYDVAIYLLCCFFFFVIAPSELDKYSLAGILRPTILGGIVIFSARYAARLYHQIWRFCNIRLYLRLILCDAFSATLLLITNSLFIKAYTFVRGSSLFMMNLLMSITIRVVYQYCFQNFRSQSIYGKVIRKTATFVSGIRFDHLSLPEQTPSKSKPVAIWGAGRVGAMLAEELLNRPTSPRRPVCFFDSDKGKIGRKVFDLSVFSEKYITNEFMKSMGVDEIIIAMEGLDSDAKKEMLRVCKSAGCTAKLYDYPIMQDAKTSDKRQLREFDIEDLLSRPAITLSNEKTSAYYRDKVVLITGGGGSIGSELCRQIAKMQPKQLIILDIYENGAYDIQQELREKYGSTLKLNIEIASVCNRTQIEKIFEHYQPQIILHAAAHKHVPLMEHNVCEAIFNNVFGTQVVAETALKCKAERFIMVSTDKAVNPTNVMGATKRMCEMLALSKARDGVTAFSATRFGNVLGSAGSVIPLFKRQIARGGPVTVTDKRIIRYFMTIPEASQLVLESGAMAKSGELFVLDMGKPVKILDLAENMIRLSGFEPDRDIKIEETGLRPGEKLYEELLIRSENLSKTENQLIFIEQENDLPTCEEVEQKLALLRRAVETNDDELARSALKEAVPTYHSPEEINRSAELSKEMKAVHA